MRTGTMYVRTSARVVYIQRCSWRQLSRGICRLSAIQLCIVHPRSLRSLHSYSSSCLPPDLSSMASQEPPAPAPSSSVQPVPTSSAHDGSSPIVVASPINPSVVEAVRVVVQQEVRAALQSLMDVPQSGPGTSSTAAPLPLASGLGK